MELRVKPVKIRSHLVDVVQRFNNFLSFGGLLGQNFPYFLQLFRIIFRNRLKEDFIQIEIWDFDRFFL